MTDERATGLTQKELTLRVWDEVKELRLEVGQRFGQMEGRIDTLERYRDRGHWPRLIATAVVTAAASGLATGFIVIRMVG